MGWRWPVRQCPRCWEGQVPRFSPALARPEWWRHSCSLPAGAGMETISEAAFSFSTALTQLFILHSRQVC